jgi:alpha-tubulin suppressor-like RCC1 family protein
MNFRAQHRRRAFQLGRTVVLAGVVAGLTMALGASAVSASNRAMSWGYNAWGRLGNGSGTFYETDEFHLPNWLPAPVCAASTTGECPSGPYLNEVSAISAGGAHDLALLSNGTVAAWGENESGQLGDGTHTGPGACVFRFGFPREELEELRSCTPTPVLVSGLSGVSATAAGSAHSLALMSGGTVMAWGNNDNGQLGGGSTTSSDVPIAVSGLSGVTAISAGDGYSLALLSNGTVMAWGDNQSGQLGDGTTNDRHVPVPVGGLTGVSAIAAGGSHSLALLSNGSVMAWGANGSGQLGDGGTETSHVPVAVSGLSGVAAVSAGGEHSLALLGNGSIMSWGDNSAGSLGIGGGGEAPASSDVPVEVCGVGDSQGQLCATGPFLSGAAAVSAGPDHSMALLNTGAVVSWGAGCRGQLGNGTGASGRIVCTVRSDVPVEASGLSDVNGISAGPAYSMVFGPAAAAVTGLGPTQGLEAGGTTVSIAGTNFTAGATVAFGSASATKVTVNSTSSITATSPAGTGTVDVTVTTAEGTSSVRPADRFRYIPVPPPTVTKVKPAKGSVLGGATVTITGASFTEVESVKFGSVAAASYTVNSVSSITAVSPPEVAGKVNVTVTTPIGTSALSTKDHFNYTPAVTGVSPSNGPKAGGTGVTVSGTGFAVGATATLFKFGTTKATAVNCTSSTTCTATVPAHAVGTVDVKAVVNKVASAKNAPADQYTYN